MSETEVTSLAVPFASATAEPEGIFEFWHWPTLPPVAQAPLVTPVIVGVVIVGDVASTGEPLPVTAVTVAVPALKIGTPLAALLFAPRPPWLVVMGVVKPVSDEMLLFAPEVATD